MKKDESRDYLQIDILKKSIFLPLDMSILYLDDMQMMRDKMVKDLTGFGFKGKIHTTDRIADAINYLKENKVEFIFSDWHLLDGETGHQFLLKVRELKGYSDIPFLMVTTEDEAEKMVQAILDGASEYLVKPWEPSPLMKKICFAWEKHNG